MNKMFLFPELVKKVSIDKQEDVEIPFDYVSSYARKQFPERDMVLQEISQAWDEMLGENDLMDVEDCYWESTVYLSDVTRYFLCHGQLAAIHEFMGMEGNVAQLRFQIDSGLDAFLQSSQMSARRLLVLEGLKQASAIIQKPDAERRYYSARLKYHLLDCYLLVIAGYEQTVAQFIAFDGDYPVQQDFLKELHQTFNQLYNDYPSTLLEF